MSSATTATAQQPSDKRWLAVAPGRVEPPSGMIKVAAPTIGIVSKVLVKVNDTVFAGEPLILLNDDEIQARYAAAEAQAGDAPAAARRAGGHRQGRATAARPRMRWPRPRRRCSTRRPRSTGPRSQWRATGGPDADADQRARRRWRAPRTSWPSARPQLARRSTRRCRRRSRRRSISARGDLAFARVNLEKLTIRAPIDGTVLQININPGELARRRRCSRCC